jgi:uncharacterized protein (UPF0262 family)
MFIPPSLNFDSVQNLGRRDRDMYTVTHFKLSLSLLEAVHVHNSDNSSTTGRLQLAVSPIRGVMQEYYLQQAHMTL